MKAISLFLTTALCLCLGACTNDIESGRGYPSLELGNSTVTYKISKVLQNDQDIKPYFEFFDGVTLTLTYKNNKPSTLTLTEAGAPFRVTGMSYDQLFEADWEINTASTPYQIRIKATGEVFGYITRDRMITFNFGLGAPSNKYQYQLTPVVDTEE